MGFLRALFSKEIGAFLGGGVKVFGKAWKAAGIAANSTAISKRSWSSFKFALIMNTVPSLLMPGSPQEKLDNIAWGLGATFLTLGMNSPWRQAFWGMALSMAPNFSGMARGIVQGYRSGLEARTSLAIPFSHSTMSMDLAFANLSYSQQRMSEAYSTVGQEAPLFAAKYLSRG